MCASQLAGENQKVIDSMCKLCVCVIVVGAFRCLLFKPPECSDHKKTHSTFFLSLGPHGSCRELQNNQKPAMKNYLLLLSVVTDN